MDTIRKGQRFKRQGKIYEAHEDSYPHPHKGWNTVKYQAINSLTDKPWQAMRWCPTSECEPLEGKKT